MTRGQSLIQAKARCKKNWLHLVSNLSSKMGRLGEWGWEAEPVGRGHRSELASLALYVRSWGFSSVEKSLPSKHKALCSRPSSVVSASARLCQ